MKKSKFLRSEVGPFLMLDVMKIRQKLHRRETIYRQTDKLTADHPLFSRPNLNDISCSPKKKEGK